MRNLVNTLDSLRPYRVFDRPIFILSAPRSGSTYLFELISRFQNVWRWHAELDDIWWARFPYERDDNPSDYIAGSEYTPEAGRRIRRDHYRYAYWAREERGEPCGPVEILAGRRVRFLDKTIANCFHLEILEKIFPDAIYLFLVRDPRATISSMMEGWRDPEQFSKPQLSPYLNRHSTQLSHWSYPAPLGWQEIVHQPLEQICAWSWERHVQSAADFLQSLSPRRYLQITYERLVRTPEQVAEEIAHHCQLEPAPQLENFLREKPLSRTTVSAPEAEKWKRLHGAEIERVMPILEHWIHRFGYAVDSIETGRISNSGIPHTDSIDHSQ